MVVQCKIYGVRYKKNFTKIVKSKTGNLFIEYQYINFCFYLG